MFQVVSKCQKRDFVEGRHFPEPLRNQKEKSALFANIEAQRHPLQVCPTTPSLTIPSSTSASSAPRLPKQRRRVGQQN